MTQETSKVINMTNDNSAANIPIAGTIIAFNDPALKALSVLSAAIMLQAPQFAYQANPSSMVALADTIYKYAVNELPVAVATEEEAKADGQAKFA